MSVCVQAVQMAGGDRTWTVLGTDHRHVGPAEEFLEYHRVTGSSPHTVRAYAKALQLWWRYLELDGRDWAEADVPALAGFVTWMRQGTPPGVVLLDPAAAAPPGWRNRRWPRGWPRWSASTGITMTCTGWLRRWPGRGPGRRGAAVTGRSWPTWMAGPVPAGAARCRCGAGGGRSARC
jgi:hypothetical protein